MSVTKPPRPAFLPIEVDLDDENSNFEEQLEAKAAEKGIPKLVTPKAEPGAELCPPTPSKRPTPRSASLVYSRVPASASGSLG